MARDKAGGGAGGGGSAAAKKTAAASKKNMQFYIGVGVAVAVVGFSLWLAMAPIPGDTRAPMGTQAIFDRAGKYHSNGETAKAIAELQEFVDRHPSFPDGHYTLALYMRLHGDHRGSVDHNRRAFELKPVFPEAYINAGVSLVELQDRKGARAYYEKALEVSPNFFMGFNSLGILDQDEGRVVEARHNYKQALSVRPNSDEIRIKLALMMPPVYPSLAAMKAEWKRVTRDVAQLLTRPDLKVNDAYRDVGMAPFYLAYSGLNSRPLMEQIYQMFIRADPNLLHVTPHLAGFVNSGGKFPSTKDRNEAVPYSPGNRIRVGIISRHLRWHSIGKLMRGLIKYLPRDKIELFVIFPTQATDDTSREIEASVGSDHFIRVSLQLRVARHQISQLRLHALLYADIGMESFTYYMAFSRLAPVQLVTHGHPCTTGLPTIDYFVSFEDYEPAENQQYYTERLLRIGGHSSRYIKPIPAEPRQNRTNWGFTFDDHIYMAPQSIFKFHPDFDPVIVKILHRDPSAKLSIIDERHEGWAAKLLTRLREYAKSQKIDPAVIDRIVFVPRVPNSVFLNYLAEADVLLDPHPFGGDTSTREALLMGTPVVTFPSPQLAGRYSASFVRRLGAGLDKELIASNLDDYVERALKLGTDSNYRKEIKAKVAKHSGRLFDDQGVITAWEQMFLEKVGAVMNGTPVQKVVHPNVSADTTDSSDSSSSSSGGSDKKKKKAERARK